MVRRDLAGAAAALEKAVLASDDDPALWMKLAGVRRATGHPSEALDAVHKALAIAPRDFTALLMRASLLQRLGRPEAGEAWGHALAQKPSSAVPDELERVIAEAQRHHEAWLAEREAVLVDRMSSAEQRADEEQRRRIARFRTNALRRTRAFHSEPTDYHFPELTEREFHPRRLFPWIEEIEAATDTIRDELRHVMAEERAELVPYVQFDEHVPMDQWRALNKSADWTAIHLVQHGRVIEANARHCPTTMTLLKKVPQPVVRGASPNAMFSLLAPRTEIPPHVGISNTRLVCHVPLIVPEGCWFRVGAETRRWKPGEAFVFDDTMEHEAANSSDDLRVVLIFDVWHPDLSDVEREAAAALIGASGAPSAAL
ncbi:MAG: tetratricopeptide repeat protein [Sphingomonas sp.]|nr:tetratricopeptide repeat protein [Sphingomonas sp.]